MPIRRPSQRTLALELRTQPGEERHVDPRPREHPLTRLGERPVLDRSLRAQRTRVPDSTEARDPLDEQVEEAVRIEVDSDVRVRRAVGSPPAIDHGTSTTELRLELDLDVAVTCLAEDLGLTTCATATASWIGAPFQP